ncbi:MAG TPA: hypothetical protein VKU44_11935 [Terriglobia bacterium]|nr:hypothetical protein [Terriglobia bacterium]
MADPAERRIPSVTRCILIPSLITLAVTLLRLVGELEQWQRAWFNPDQGGYLSIVGIVWLAPLFGGYFALRLAAAGERTTAGRSIVLAAAGCVVFAVGFYLFNAGRIHGMTGVIVMWVLAALGAGLAFPAWPALFRILMAYAFAARIPVAIVMLIATWAGWQSHYNAEVAGYSKVETYILYALIPQLEWWVAYTIVAGSLLGTTIAAMTGLRRQPEPGRGSKPP